MATKEFNIIGKTEAKKIVGGYRTYASKAGCESREGAGNCTYSSKQKQWLAGGVFSSNGK